MDLSVVLILGLLEYEYESNDTNLSIRFDSVELLDTEMPSGRTKTLYVGGLSDALLVQHAHPQLHFLCVRDRMVDEMETEEAMAHISIVKKNLRPQELFNQTQRAFLRVVNWKVDLLRSVSKREGIQALMDLSESMIGNHIAVMDSSFKLIGYTKHIETDDVVANELTRHGYHPKETIQQFQKFGRYTQFEQEDDIIVSDDYAMSEYVTVKRVFHENNTYTMLAVMVCCRKYSEGILELFRILMEMLQLYVKSGLYIKDTGRPVASLLKDIMDGKLKSTDEAYRRAGSIGIAFHGTFQLLLLRFMNEENFPFRRVVSELSTAFPVFDTVLYQKNILMLYRGTIPDDIGQQLQKILQLYSFQCGISNTFCVLTELPTAYQQAYTAIRIGQELAEKDVDPSDVPKTSFAEVYRFRDYVLYYQMQLILEHDEGILDNSMAIQSLKTLKESASRYSVDYPNILYTFLQCERRATLASQKLCMHRNTVLYHVGKIEEMLGITLDDPDTRLQLLLGFKMLELKPVTE